jgi:[ribosomal protein S5]-alanine N-acetyltransferase
LKLSTHRLDLVPATLDHINAELEAPEHLAALLGAQVESGWPPGEYDRGAQEFFRDRMKEGGADVVGWYGWYAIMRGTMNHPSVVVGAAGYFGPPSPEGAVEIGFSVMPEQQGFGYAIEMAGALVEHAFADGRVNKIIAHTTPANVASRKVLERCGFRYVRHEELSGNDLFEIPGNIFA